MALASHPKAAQCFLSCRWAVGRLVPSEMKCAVALTPSSPLQPQHRAGIWLYGCGGHRRLQGPHGWSPSHTDAALDTKSQRLPVATVEMVCRGPPQMAIDCFWQCHRNQESVTSLSPRPTFGTRHIEYGVLVHPGSMLHSQPTHLKPWAVCRTRGSAPRVGGAW